jgi:hypothetical protein
LADLILSALLDCTEGDLDSRSGELESLLEQELDNLEQLQSESAQQLMLGIDDFIADEVTEGTANNILVACVVGKVFNEAESDDDVLVTLPPIFMSLEGLTPEDWNDGGRDTIRASLAAVLLGNPDLDQYIDVELVDEPDNKRKLLQATSVSHHIHASSPRLDLQLLSATAPFSLVNLRLCLHWLLHVYRPLILAACGSVLYSVIHL